MTAKYSIDNRSTRMQCTWHGPSIIIMSCAKLQRNVRIQNDSFDRLSQTQSQSWHQLLTYSRTANHSEGQTSAAGNPWCNSSICTASLCTGLTAWRLSFSLVFQPENIQNCQTTPSSEVWEQDGDVTRHGGNESASHDRSTWLVIIAVVNKTSTLKLIKYYFGKLYTVSLILN